MNAAARRGEQLEANKKYFAGSNRQHKVDKNTARLDDETEELHHDRVPLELGKVLQQSRSAKEWTQKARECFLLFNNITSSILGLEHKNQRKGRSCS